MGRSTLTQRHTARLGPDQREILDTAWQPTGAIQLDADAHTGLADDELRAAAGHGIAGAGQPLPYLDQLQRSFGDHDLSGVRAHFGAPAQQANAALGANAYATGNDIAFATEAPNLHLVAHETAHVVQQRGGVQLSSAVGQAGDSYEQQADAVADRVVNGESVAQLLGDPSSQSGEGTQLQRAPDHESKAADRTPPRSLRLRGPGSMGAPESMSINVGDSADLTWIAPVDDPARYDIQWNSNFGGEHFAGAPFSLGVDGPKASFQGQAIRPGQARVEVTCTVKDRTDASAPDQIGRAVVSYRVHPAGGSVATTTKWSEEGVENGTAAITDQDDARVVIRAQFAQPLGGSLELAYDKLTAFDAGAVKSDTKWADDLMSAEFILEVSRPGQLHVRAIADFGAAGQAFHQLPLTVSLRGERKAILLSKANTLLVRHYGKFVEWASEAHRNWDSALTDFKGTLDAQAKAEAATRDFVIAVVTASLGGLIGGAVSKSVQSFLEGASRPWTGAATRLSSRSIAAAATGVADPVKRSVGRAGQTLQGPAPVEFEAEAPFEAIESSASAELEAIVDSLLQFHDDAMVQDLTFDPAAEIEAAWAEAGLGTLGPANAPSKDALLQSLFCEWLERNHPVHLPETIAAGIESAFGGREGAMPELAKHGYEYDSWIGWHCPDHKGEPYYPSMSSVPNLMENLAPGRKH